MSMDAHKIAQYHKDLLSWYENKGRTLPWRETSDPYHILVSEVMLQQTQVDRVMPKYFEFLQAFPTLEVLASATNGEVLRVWSGLGYNSRALRLKGIAEESMRLYGGVLPKRREELLNLKGIGPYTSGAIMAFAYRIPVSFIDTNIKRLVHRVFIGSELQGWKKKEKEMEKIVETVCDYGENYAYHQALMDLGATICKATKMDCASCPLKYICVTRKEIESNPMILSEKRVSYKKTVPFKESKRYIRGAVVEYLRLLPEGATFQEIEKVIHKTRKITEQSYLLGILEDLVEEGMLRKEKEYYVL